MKRRSEKISGVLFFFGKFLAKTDLKSEGDKQRKKNKSLSRVVRKFDSCELNSRRFDDRSDDYFACTIKHLTVVGRGYFSHASSYRENVTSARRVFGFLMLGKKLLPSSHVSEPARFRS